MKKLITFICLIGLTFTTQAQEFKKFKLGLGLGYAAPSDGGGGILIDFEPAYRINDALCIGLRLESAAMARSIGDAEASVQGSGSYTLNAQYYLSNNNFRPYVGAGVGLFSTASASVNSGGVSASIDSETVIGFYPRVGFDLGHFNVNIDYNLVTKTSADDIDISNGGEELDDIKNSYLGIRIGAFIFGGRN